MIGAALRNRPCGLILLFAVLPLAAVSAGAKGTKTVEFRAEVTAVEPPDAFDVPGYHVVMTETTQMVSFYKFTKDAGELRKAIGAGTVVDVRGTEDASGHTVTAEQVVVHDDADGSDRKMSGFGVIDRMLSSGPDPVFRADGYVLRVNAGTHVEFSGALSALSQVNTSIWIQYKGFRNDSGEIALTWVNFIKPRLKAPKRDAHVTPTQMTVFPPGSIIDFDGSFRTDGNDRNKHKIVDKGGPCGWYPVSNDMALQQRVQRIGFKVIPQYQRELPNDDPAKVLFRFYAVEEEDIHSDLGCENDGLVLVAVDAVKRLQNDDQLAALLADGVAAKLLAHRARLIQESDWVEIGSAVALGGWVAGTIVAHEIQRKLVEQRGRMALGYLDDAGYDPWQSPEAWRLLAPSQLPKKLSKLKYPSRSKRELEILELEYKRPAGTAAASGNN